MPPHSRCLLGKQKTPRLWLNASRDERFSRGATLIRQPTHRVRWKCLPYLRVQDLSDTLDLDNGGVSGVDYCQADCLFSPTQLSGPFIGRASRLILSILKLSVLRLAKYYSGSQPLV